MSRWVARVQAFVFGEVPHFDGTGFINGQESVAVSAKGDIVNSAHMGVRVQEEAEVVGEDAVDLASLGANNQFLLVIREVHSHDSRVELCLMCQSPRTARKVDFLDLSIATADEEHLFVDAPTDDTVRSKRHRSPVQLLGDAEDTHLSASRSRQQHISIDQGEVIGSHEARVRKLAGSARQEVLHRADVEFQLIDGNLQGVTRDKSVCRVFRVDGGVAVAPLEE